MYPTFVRKRTVRNEAVEVELPSIAGYIFIEFDASVQPWRRINGTRGIRRLICEGVRPIPLRSREEAIIREMCAEGPGVDPEDALARLAGGEFIRMKEGVLAGELGRFEGWTKSGLAKVLFAVLFGGREMIVSVNPSLISVEAN